MALEGFRLVAHRLKQLDADSFEAIASLKSPLIDATMPRLTNAADYSKLWMGAALALRLSGKPRLRRAAGRGVLSLAATSLITNQLAKRVHGRERPGVGSIPTSRRSRRRPTSSSFPSGHSASAAAFAAGVGIEDPVMGTIMGGLAGAVGFSRIATGAHYPSDVLAGFALGAGIAALGAKLVPPLGSLPVVRHEPHRVEQEPRPDGDGMTIVVNIKAGVFDREPELQLIEHRLPAAKIVRCEEGDDLPALMAQAAQDADVLGAMGGDGTMGCAAQAAMDAGKPLAVFTGGTFNHFAKDLGVFYHGDTVAAVRKGQTIKIDVGYLDDKLFLNTASAGAYADFVRIREKYQKSMTKPTAMLFAGLRMMRAGKAMRLRWNGVERDIALLFIGNSRYEPSGFAPAIRPNIDDGLLDVRMLEYHRGWRRAVLLFDLISGQLGRSQSYHQLSVPHIDIESVDNAVQVTRDGELDEWTKTLRVRAEFQALTVYKPW